MSLINDVLRDMDQRHAPVSVTTDDNKTIVVPPARRKKFPPSWLFLLAVGLIIGGLAGALVYDRILPRSQPTTAERLAASPTDTRPDTKPTETGQHTHLSEPLATEAKPTKAEVLAAAPHANSPAPTDQTEPAQTSKASSAQSNTLQPDTSAGQISQAQAMPGLLPATAPTDTAKEAAMPEVSAAPDVAADKQAEITSELTLQSVFIQPGIRLNVRAQPSLQSEVISIVDENSALSLIQSHPQFHQIAMQDSRTGWVSRRYASLTAYPPSQAQTGDTSASPSSSAQSSRASSTTALTQQAVAQTTSPPPVQRVSNQADALYRQALRALERDDLAQAETALQRTLAASPTHTDALNALAALLLRQQRQAELEALLDSLATPQARLLQARLLAERGQHAQAASLLSQLPDNQLGAEGFATLGAMQQRTGQHHAAINAFQRALSLGHRHASTFAGLAVSLEATSRLDEARSAWLNTLAAGNADPALAAHARRRLGSTAHTGD